MILGMIKCLLEDNFWLCFIIVKRIMLGKRIRREEKKGGGEGMLINLWEKKQFCCYGSFAVGFTNEFLSIWFWYELKKVHCFNKLARHLSLEPSETCLPYCSSQLELRGQGYCTWKTTICSRTIWRVN